MSIILETERLTLREMIMEDLPSLADIMQDGQTMYAYEGAFNDDETRNWLDKQLARYKEDGFGLWAVVLKENAKMIGQCGITWQDADGKRVLEIGYLLNHAYWHKGYAIEAAVGCKLYAFEALNADEVCSIIRETNIASMNVAIRNGMTVSGSFVKRYREVDMPHLIFSVRRNRTAGNLEEETNNIMEYIVIEKHETEFPSPLLLQRNEKVIVKGESEHWQGWIYCIKTDGANEGYVPKQIVEYTDNYGIITEDYSAKELNGREGNILEGIKELNGWMWAKNKKTHETGWIPVKNIKLLEK